MKDEVRLCVRADEAAKMLGVPRSSFWKLLQDGEIASFKIGRLRMVAMSELRRFIEDQTKKQG